MAAASTAPVYGPLTPYRYRYRRRTDAEPRGRGADRWASCRQAAGRRRASIAGGCQHSRPPSWRVDWRQVRRWGIDEKALPRETVVYFREPTFWEAYRNIAIGAIALILLPGALITGLLIEHRRRHIAELALQKQHTELAHASRLAVAGELTASIAHEINQPLGAVQTSADAADHLILRAGGNRRDDLIRIVTRIRKDTLRASDVIRRLRAMLARHEPESQPFDINVVVGDVAALLRRGSTKGSDFGS